MTSDALAIWILGTAVVALCLLALGLLHTVLWVSAGAAKAEEHDARRRWEEARAGD